jgi:spore photoproduct lyase
MKIKNVYIEAPALDLPETQRFLRRIGLDPVVIQHHNELYEIIKQASDPYSAGKQSLLLTRNQGPFLRQCPGTREYICCGYNILNFATYCTMDCAYCILQSYFHPPVLQYFVNQDKLWKELDHALAQPRTLRVGTGEFTDSLIWEPWSDLTPKLIDRFANQTHSILELKTKTTAIDRLEGLRHHRKTIISWSLNTPRVIATQERATTSLHARLRAAAQCASWGYPVAFHFDPIVLYPGCEKEYEEVIQTLFEHVGADNIVWISMGTFRFMPALQTIVQKRFARSDIVYGEFVPGLDGKMRYFKPLRINIYQRMVAAIHKYAPYTTVYLCMEDEHVWLKSVGFAPDAKGGLPAMLDQSAIHHCGLVACT